MAVAGIVNLTNPAYGPSERGFSMIAKYDDEQVELTERFVNALIELMQAECEMMAKFDSAEFWTWGRCTVIDLAISGGTEFSFGGDDDLPSDGLGKFAVVVTD